MIQAKSPQLVLGNRRRWGQGRRSGTTHGSPWAIPGPKGLLVQFDGENKITKKTHL